MKLSNYDLLHAVVTFNADPWLLESEWDVENFVNGTDFAARLLERTDPFWDTYCAKLDLEPDTDRPIYQIAFVNGDVALAALEVE